LMQTILVRQATRAALALAMLAGSLGLAACGQKGNLYLPTGADAVGRASLPQTLNPFRSGEAAAAPTRPASAPATPARPTP